MIYEISLKGRTVSYELVRKKVKNINLRIKADGSVFVSASRLVPKAVVDAFLLSKSDFILKAIDRHKESVKMPPKLYFSEQELRTLVTELCRKAYPYYEKRGVAYPQIKFRKMVSRWGSCHPTKGVLTFNINLVYAPPSCVEYVVWHEFTHFLQANHSPKFYEELAKVCPDWKRQRNCLREVCIPRR
ncbi:MAG: DUF45 domain-containing protein [Clostridia bacterium]|nr:DUF45 domain-containing protein [Clostridia bacterium]